MKKIILVVVSIFLVSTLLTGCGKSETVDAKKYIRTLEDTNARLIAEADREIKKADEYKELLDEVKEQSAERLSTIDYLNAELAKRDSTIYSLENKMENSSSAPSTSASTTEIYSVDPGDSNSYLAQKFWFDGNNYSADTTWYWDISCKLETQMSCVTIISPIVDKMVQGNGYTVYVCMSSNGLVYSSSYPYLVKIN